MRHRRVALAVVLVAVVLVAIVARNASARRTASPVVTPASATRADDGVWFCPGAPPQYQHRNGVVTFANIGTSSATIAVTDLPDKGNAARISFAVGARSTITKTRDQLGPPGALTVETFGSRVVVEEGIEGVGAVDSASCAPSAASHAYFAAGTTVQGVQQWLVIDNPFASDAKVDVALQTDSGQRRPDVLQGLDIVGRSRYVVALDTLAVRMARVAVEVDARLGTVVATQTLVYSKTAGTPGVAMALGAPTANDTWAIAGGTTPPKSNVWLAIANVGSDDAQIDIEVHTSAKQPVVPPALTVPEGSVSWLQLGGCSTRAPATCVRIPDGARYSIDVHSEQQVPVVVQLLGHLGDTRSTIGLVTPMAQPQSATEWDFARARVGDFRQTTLFVYNPGAASAIVNLGIVHNKVVESPPGQVRVAVGPGQTVPILVMQAGKRPVSDGAILLQSTQPVLATRVIAGGTDTAASTGVPFGG